MTITDLFTVLGSAAGIAVLAVMALAPTLLDLPQRRPRQSGVEVSVPQPRRPADDGRVSALLASTGRGAAG
jgi:hypothetical protein